MLEGSLRQAGGQVRAAVKLIDTSAGANLWVTPEENRLAMAGLKQAIEQEPNHAGCLSMLGLLYANGYLLHYDADESTIRGITSGE